MPQLIAMIIIVVGAMIYMFQTFGGTGDKIEGIAQKTSVITEINNIKTGIKLAARAGDVTTKNMIVPKYKADGTLDGTNTEEVPSGLKALSSLKYFAEQINEQINSRNSNTGKPTNVSNDVWLANAYNAISFGGTSEKGGGMILSIVADKAGMVPGIFVDFNFAGSKLIESGGFLESQIANDLKDIAYIDRKALTPKSGAFTIEAGRSAAENETTAISKRTPNDSEDGGTESDGKFIVYFKDFGANEVVK